MRRPASLRSALLSGALLLAAIWVSSCGSSSTGMRWDTRSNNGTLEIAYGRGTDFPQFAALHLDSSYLRLIPTRTSGWGTSVILLPAFWAGGQYYQGAPITVQDIQQQGKQLVITLSGTIGQIAANVTVTIHPPEGGAIRAIVHVTASGTVQLDDRPGEAFKPVMLSSMHIDDTRWDAQAVLVDGQETTIPEEGWIFNPPVSGRVFGFKGGTSAWKTNSPTVLIHWPANAQVTGWATASSDPNDDNLGLWVAFDDILSEWTYTIVSQTA